MRIINKAARYVVGIHKYLAFRTNFQENENRSHLTPIEHMKTVALIALITSMLFACQQAPSDDKQSAEEKIDKQKEVNLYSARKEELMAPLLKEFTSQTGIKVNILSGKADALLTRIQSEGVNSPADVLLTTDAGRLHRAKQAGLFSPLDSSILDTIPTNYRDPESQWFGLSLRARLILLTDASNPLQISRYEDLAKPSLKGQICIRSSSNIYNQSLVASLISHSGNELTKRWASDLVKNMARAPQGGDTDQIRAAAAGQCSIAIANSYYLARLLGADKNTDDYKAASKITVVWPNQDDRGAHLNVSGAGVLKHAPNPQSAQKLIEFLVSDTAQQIYADVNYEYPIKAKIPLNPILKSMGDFKAETLPLSVLGENNAEAVRIMDQAAWK